MSQNARPTCIGGRKSEVLESKHGQKVKDPRDWYHYCLYNCGYFLWPVSPTQSVINGDKTDYSDEIASVKDGGSSNRERSRSRERCLEGENKRRDWPQEAHDRFRRAANYAVIVNTQPQSRNAKCPVPRRHTLGSSRCTADQDTKKRNEAVIDMLASRYPQYAEKISSTTSEDGVPVRGRSRDPQRRATVGVGYSQSMDYEGSTSEVDGHTFQRGGFVRSSLPVTRRSAPTSDGKPSGSVFLIFRDETKRAILPNEITHLDTVRAMFVRSFPGKLAMQYLESPKRKIYIQEPRTNIYYQLEDLGDIKNGTVLRIHECDSKDPQQVVEKPEVRGRLIQLPPGSHTYYGDTPPLVRKAQTLPAYMHQPIYMSHDDVTKSLVVSAYERSRSLTPDPSTSAAYAQNPIYGHIGMPPPERPPISQEMTGFQDQAPPVLRSIPEKYLMFNGHINNGLHGNYMDNNQPASGTPSPSSRPLQWPHTRQAISPPTVPSGPKVDTRRKAFSPPPNLQTYDHTQVGSGSMAPQGPQQGALLVRGMRTQSAIHPQRVSVARQSVPVPSSQSASIPGLPLHAQQSWCDKSPVSRRPQPMSTLPHSSPTSAQQRSQSYRVPATSEWDQSLVARPSSTTPAETTTDRIDKMEHQLANLAAWVQTAVVHTGSSTGAPSSIKSISVGSSETSPLTDSASSNVDVNWDSGPVQDEGLTHIASETTALSQDMKDYIQLIKHQADRLRTDLHSLHHLQQINKDCILETVDDAWKKIKNALSSVPGAENLLIHQERNEADVLYNIYLEDKAHAEKELADLERAVEDLRSDVLSHQCRVQIMDVEGMALVLNHITKQLGDLKVHFSKLQEQLKYVMSAEMELIVKKEKFLNEEPERLDNSLKKCKKLTGTLFTLKRLASVQEHRPPQPVSLSAQVKIPTLDDKKAVLQNIQAMVPNHEARIQRIQAAETARLIKKKITTQQESLKFGNNLTSKVAIQPYNTTISHSGHVTSSLTTTPQAWPATSSSTMASQTGTVSSGFIPYTSGITTSSPPLRPESAISQSGISFAMPVFASSPKTVSQYSVSPHNKSATSLSMSCPIVSVIQESSPKRLLLCSQSDYQKLKVAENIGQGHGQFKSGKIGKSVEFQSEPAMFSGTGSEAIEQTSQSTKSDKHSANIDIVDFNNQKSAARAAFFSSLSSPPSPTATSSPTTSVLSTESPTESLSSNSPSVCVLPIGGRMSAQTRSSLVLLSSNSANTSMISPQALYTVGKPSSLPVTSTSILSTHSFSPSSPSSGAQSNSRPRTAFTAIPKPYSPTKSTPSPLTPESPKYRIPLSYHQTNGMSTTSVSASNKTITIIQSRETSEKRKKVPPPPPPRKSSKLPGHAVFAVNVATVNGQLPKHKHTESKSQQESVCEGLQDFKSANKSHTNIVELPKQFVNIAGENINESKSSIYSLKQCTAPLSESKRDRKDDQQGKLLVGKRMFTSNLNTGEHENPVKQMEKEIDTNNDRRYKNNELISKVVDGKVTDTSEENNDDNEDSIESNGSSSSLDSQDDVISVKENATANTCSVVPHSIINMTNQSAAIISVSATEGFGISQTETASG